MPLQDLLALLEDEAYHVEYDLSPEASGWRIDFSPRGDWELNLYG